MPDMPECARLRIAVAIATVGRAALAREVVDLLSEQVRPADMVVVVGAGADDVAGIEQCAVGPHVLIAERGLCRQRNAAVRAIGDQADVVMFFDDDFVPAPDYLEELECLYADPDIVGVTGELIADGIRGSGYSVADALRMIAEQQGHARTPLRAREALYGCNMSIRLSAAHDLRFDEMLPLYGWQEDIDFTYQLARRGRLVSTSRVTGVHLGVKGGRTSGKRMGYSQVANLVYLWRKGTMQPGLGEQLLRQNLLSNLARSVRPEPHVDRRGRLLGNVIALKDWATGRIDPRRIETM